MSYTKRDWDNTGNEVTKADFIRIEDGIKNNDTVITEHENKINVLKSADLLFSGEHTGTGIITTTCSINNYNKLIFVLLRSGLYYTSVEFISRDYPSNIVYDSFAIPILDGSGAIGILQFIPNGTSLNISSVPDNNIIIKKILGRK